MSIAMVSQTRGMTTLLAWRNLVHDPVRAGATLVGIVFSVTLMTIQSSLLMGFSQTASGLVDHADADIWIVSRGTTNVDQSVILPQRDLYKALQVPGVATAVRSIVRYVDWRKPNGGSELVILVGCVTASGMGLPWNLVEGAADSLNEPDGVVLDRLYAAKLGFKGLGQEVEIRGRRAKIVGLTDGIRTFTQSPYVFTSYNNALKFTDLRDGDESYVLVRVAPGASVEAVAAGLRGQVPDADVLTGAQFSARTRNYWVYTTGAGLSLWLGSLLSAIVGITIVAQTLYAATIERLAEYATLSAMGASSRYLYAIVVKQALIGGGFGWVCGLAIAFVLFSLAQRGPVALELSPGLVFGIGAFTLFMCVSASMLAVRKLMTIDPTSVFK
jgi:putative ABC transport system permease protein